MKSLFSRMIARIGYRKSLDKRMSTAMNVLLVLMLVPALVSVGLMLVFSAQYHSVIVHMDEVSSLMPMIQDELVIETSNIVVGRTRFDAGSQYEILGELKRRLDALINSGAASQRELEVAKRTLSTMEKKIGALGEQLGNSARVDETMHTQDEIRDIGTLCVELLQKSIKAEIEASAKASDRMQQVIRTTMLLEVALLLITLLFAVAARRSLARTIQQPIDRLKLFAGRIAAGSLKERAVPPDIDELHDLTISLNAMAEKLEQLIEENNLEQQNLKKSELRTLQAQITPHFLYNTLDAIISLAESKRVEEVVEITTALSSFYRTSLNNGKDWITIAQEQQHLDGYLTILRVRYRDILKYEIYIDERLRGSIILKLLVQPLVENALYHGIKNRRGGGMLQIRIERDGDRMMRVSVRDSGAGMDQDRLFQTRMALARSEPLAAESGYGLYSVDKRIKLYYNQQNGLQIDSIKGEGTTVWFTVPVKGTAHV